MRPRRTHSHVPAAASQRSVGASVSAPRARASSGYGGATEATLELLREGVALALVAFLTRQRQVLYGVASCGGAPVDVIAEYVRSQKGAAPLCGGASPPR